MSEFWKGKNVFLEIDSEGFILGYSSSSFSEKELVLDAEMLPELFFEDCLNYRYLNKKIIYDNTKSMYEKTEQDRINSLPNDKERIEMLENMVLDILMMEMRNK